MTRGQLPPNSRLVPSVTCDPHCISVGSLVLASEGEVLVLVLEGSVLVTCTVTPTVSIGPLT